MNLGKTLVTGGAGFIGSHIAEALVAEGVEVRILDNFSSGKRENLKGFGSAIEVVEGDICDPAALAGAMQGVKHVFHEAALVSVTVSVEHPMDNDSINIRGTLNVLQAAREAGVKRVVLATSAAVYGNNPELPKRETMLPEPESPYALGKLAGEYYMKLYSHLYGVETVSLRYFNVFGPRQDGKSMYSGVISRFAADIRQGRAPTIFGDGGQTRDFVFVKDVVHANLLAMKTDSVGKGEIFNVATGRQITLLKLWEILKGISGSDLKPGFKEARLGDIRHSVADISRIRKDLGYEPKFSMEEGLSALMDGLGKERTR
ncbi:MAG: SDR family oxidoreductase [bacterium]